MLNEHDEREKAIADAVEFAETCVWRTLCPVETGIIRTAFAAGALYESMKALRAIDARLNKSPAVDAAAATDVPTA